MIPDETIERDLRRIMNDRDVNHRHRDAARRALSIISQMGDDDTADPDQTDFRANFEEMTAREEQHLQMLGVDLD